MKDNYGRKINYMRISLTDLCNLRCKYCMPEEGVKKKKHREIMRHEDLFMAVRIAAELGIEKIRLTGGEPLVKRGIVNICKEISSIPGIKELCITTNGTLLKNFAEPLKKVGVDRLNISIDTLNPNKYAEITRTGNLKDVLDGIKAAENAGFEHTKINAVLIKGFNDEEIPAFLNITKERDIEVRFIELMPIGDGIGFNRKQFISGDEVLKRMPELKPLDQSDGVAKLYSLPGAKGRVGLIRPISCDFCDECNKIRLTADGKLKPCLHSNQEFSILNKDYDKMKTIMREAILGKPERRKQLDSAHPSNSARNMNEIGG